MPREPLSEAQSTSPSHRSAPGSLDPTGRLRRRLAGRAQADRPARRRRSRTRGNRVAARDREGCPRLLRDDVTRAALLIERLGRSLYELRLPTRRRHEILISAAARIWRPAPVCGLPTGATKAQWLAEFITAMWEELDRPCNERAVEHALACTTRRGDAHRDETAVLVHGDVHQWNALEAGREFKLVDPDGLLAEPEYDLGIIMREDPLDGDLRKRARWLADKTGLDEDAIWEWGVVERSRRSAGTRRRAPADREPDAGRSRRALRSDARLAVPYRPTCAPRLSWPPPRSQRRTQAPPCVVAAREREGEAGGEAVACAVGVDRPGDGRAKVPSSPAVRRAALAPPRRHDKFGSGSS